MDYFAPGFADDDRGNMILVSGIVYFHIVRSCSRRRGQFCRMLLIPFDESLIVELPVLTLRKFHNAGVYLSAGRSVEEIVFIQGVGSHDAVLSRSPDTVKERSAAFVYADLLFGETFVVDKSAPENLLRIICHIDIDEDVLLVTLFDIVNHLLVRAPIVVDGILVIQLAETMATDSLSLAHVNALSVASSGSTVAVSVSVSPISSSAVSGVTCTDDTARNGSCSKVRIIGSTFPALSFTVALPVRASPSFASTLNTKVPLFIALVSTKWSHDWADCSISTVYEVLYWMGNSAVPPCTGALAVFPVMTIFGASVTVTEQVAVLLPSVVVTVTAADPAFTAVTLPLPSTVATSVAEDFQLTDLSLAFSGLTVAVSVSEEPSARLRVVLSRVTPVTATVVGVGEGSGSGCGSFVPHPAIIPADRASARNDDMMGEKTDFIS